MTKAEAFLKKEIDSLLQSNRVLADANKQITLLKLDLEEMTAGKTKAEDATIATERQLQAEIDSHATTAQKLQMATMFLQVCTAVVGRHNQSAKQ